MVESYGIVYEHDEKDSEETGTPHRKGKFGRFFKRIIPQKIAVKLALVICLLVMTLLSFLGITLNQIASKVLKQNIREGHQKIAVRAAREISLFVERPVELLKIAGQLLGRTQDRAWDQETILVEMSLEFPFFEEIVSLNPQGGEMASSNPGRPKKNRRQEKGFQEALQGKTSMSSVFIGENYLPYVWVTLAYDSRGKPAGILMARVNLRGLWEIVDGIRIGKTGWAFLATKEGLLVAHPDRRLVLKNTVLNANSIFKNVTWAKDKSVETRDASGKRYVVSYAPVEGNLPLFIGIQMETGEAYQFLGRMKLLIWLILLFSSVISIMVSFRLAQLLVQPVKMLQLWSKRVALGDFDYRLPPKSSDELGRLFLRFKHMSRRLKMAREREHLVAIGVAASTISHKFKNSIVSLKTFSQLLPQRKTDAIFMQRFERDFAGAIENLEKIFNSLSQIASAKKSDVEEIHLDGLFVSLRELYAETAGRLGIDFRLKMAPDCPTIEGDREQLRELFENLIQNSLQAMPQGGLLLLKTEYDPEISYVRISVRDTGCGISTHYLGKIFQPFFTTKHGGMGLGLTISKKIVEDHSGNISVVSMEGKGTVFLVDLPVNQPQKLTKEYSSKISQPAY